MFLKGGLVFSVLFIATSIALGDWCIKQSVDKIPILNDSSSINVDTNFLYVCDKNYSECECSDGILDCRGFRHFKLNHTGIKVSGNHSFKVAIFSNHDIMKLRKRQLLFGHESGIEELDFSRNFISTIDGHVFDNFNSLKKLALKDNLIHSMTDKILTKKLCATLLELDLADNCLQCLSASVFQHLNNLAMLDMSQNTQLMFSEQMHSIFSPALSNLKVLKLYACNISALNENVFSNLGNLKMLYMSKNPLTSIPKAFNNLNNLILLDLSHNRIKHIEDCDFCHLNKLKDLDLEYSWIESIHENAFGSITKQSIKNFSIYNCNVRHLPERLLDWMHMEHIEIQQNPFECNCSMAWLINSINSSSKMPLINRKNEHYESTLVCSWPSNLIGKHLQKLSMQNCQNYDLLLSIFIVVLFAALLLALCFYKKSYQNDNHQTDQDALENYFETTFV